MSQSIEVQKVAKEVMSGVQKAASETTRDVQKLNKEELKMQGEKMLAESKSLRIDAMKARMDKKYDLAYQLEKEAYSNVLYRLMIEEITTLEKIEVTKEEAEEEATKLAEKYQMKKEEFLEQFGGIDMIMYDLEMRKTIERLKELNK